MSEPLVRLRNLRKAYGRRQALSGIDLTLTRPEVVGIVGPDGAPWVTDSGTNAIALYFDSSAVVDTSRGWTTSNNTGSTMMFRGGASPRPLLMWR